MPLGQLVAVPFDILHVTPKVVLCKVAAAKTLLTRCLLLILPPEHHQHQSDFLLGCPMDMSTRPHLTASLTNL